MPHLRLGLGGPAEVVKIPSPTTCKSSGQGKRSREEGRALVEATHSGAVTWLHDLWEQRDDDASVWRLEFQHGSRCLSSSACTLSA